MYNSSLEPVQKFRTPVEYHKAWTLVGWRVFNYPQSAIGNGFSRREYRVQVVRVGVYRLSDQHLCVVGAISDVGVDHHIPSLSPGDAQESAFPRGGRTYVGRELQH